MNEEELLKKFKEIITNKLNISQKNINLSPKNNSKQMDVVLMDDLTKTLICLEAKIFNNTNSNSSNFLSIFGKILKGRSLKSNINYNDYNYIEYGVLIAKDNVELFKKYLSIIDLNDWNIFCKEFELKYIYVLDENDYEVFNSIEYRNDNQINIDNYYKAVNGNEIIEDDDND